MQALTGQPHNVPSGSSSAEPVLPFAGPASTRAEVPTHAGNGTHGGAQGREAQHVLSVTSRPHLAATGSRFVIAITVAIPIACDLRGKANERHPQQMGDHS